MDTLTSALISAFPMVSFQVKGNVASSFFWRVEKLEGRYLVTGTNDHESNLRYGVFASTEKEVVALITKDNNDEFRGLV